MPENRFYCSNLSTETALVTGQEALHLRQVMRKKEGEEIELIDGCGHLAHAKIQSIKKTEVLLNIERIEKIPPPTKTLSLFQGQPKLTTLELICKACTEIGVTHFHILETERSDRKTLTPQQHQRLLTILIGAIKQSGRLYLPSLQFTHLNDLTKSEDSEYQLLSFQKDVTGVGNLSKPNLGLFVGPESGFSEKEENSIQKKFNATLCRINENTLRAETAAIVGSGLVANAMHGHYL